MNLLERNFLSGKLRFLLLFGDITCRRASDRFDFNSTVTVLF